MAEQNYLFTKDNKDNWHKMFSHLTGLYDRFKTTGKDFEITINFFSGKRSGSQLRAYWALIRVIKNYMNSAGNEYLDEDVSNWIKVRAGHVKGYILDGELEEIPRSISNKSDCSKKDMKSLIQTIIIFGIDHNIPNCEIVDYELDKLLQYYDD